MRLFILATSFTQISIYSTSVRCMSKPHSKQNSRIPNQFKCHLACCLIYVLYIYSSILYSAAPGIEALELHREKPSVLITSPGSPDLLISGSANGLRHRGASTGSSAQQAQRLEASHSHSSSGSGSSSTSSATLQAAVAAAAAAASGGQHSTTTAGHHHHCYPAAASPPSHAHAHPHSYSHPHNHSHVPHYGMGVTTQPIPVEGRLQLKLGYDQNTLQLIVTLVCATGLSLRQSGAGRNPYAKVSELQVKRMEIRKC